MSPFLSDRAQMVHSAYKGSENVDAGYFAFIGVNERGGDSTFKVDRKLSLPECQSIALSATNLGQHSAPHWWLAALR